MATLTGAPPPTETLADVIERLGSIPLERIPARPAPGTATEADLLRRPDGEKRLYELVDGVLVEKPMGFYESLLAGVLIQLLRNYLDQHPLGVALPPDGMLRLWPGLVRAPDVSFISWERFPDRLVPVEAIPDIAPDLAVEVLSSLNTPAEMERKLHEYFVGGTRLVWYAYPDRREVAVYTSLDQRTLVNEDGVLTGGDVVPGFELPVREWFERAGPRREA